MAQNSAGQVLGKDDIPALINILTPVASKCSALGLQLGLKVWQIDNIKENNQNNCEAQLQAILVERLNQEKPLTWKDLVTALRSDAVRHQELAQWVESQYLTPPQQEAANSPRHTDTCISSSAQLPIQQHPYISHPPTNFPRPCFPSHYPPSHYGPSPPPAVSGPSARAFWPNQHLRYPQLYTFQHSRYLQPYTFQQPLLPHPSQQSTPQYPNQNPSYNTFPYHQLPPPNLPHQQYAPYPPTNISYPSPHHSIPPTYPYYTPPYPPVHYGPPPQVVSSVASTHDVPETGAPAAKRPREQSPVRPHPQPHSLPSQQLSTSQSKPDRSPLVSQYIDYVRTVYKSSEVEQDSRSLKWPPTPSKVYINLVCIDRTKVGQWNEYDEVTKAMVQRGDIDVVRGKKWPIDFNEIAAGVPDIGQKRVVLVEGAPGVGKSTFAWEYCRRWERGEIAQQYQLVLLLRLRDERMSKAKTLRDLIYHPSEDVRQAVSDDLERSHGSKTLILLEGFDELPDTCRTQQSVFLELICGELLPLATVMVTSRPWATGMFLKHYKHRLLQRIEILGFTNEQISEYIESVLPENEAKDLESYIKTHPQIRCCMYIPLNCAIVVTVYQESQASGCPLPTTLTELYTALTQILLVRHLHGHPELGKGSQHIKVFKDLTVSCDVQRNFTELCKLAYSGIVEKNDQVRLIFKESDLPADFDNLGFMDSVTELYVTLGTVSSHNFLHLTFQEFFAAVHISTMSPAEQLQHFQRRGDGRLKEVLRFMAGITKLSCFSGEGVQHTFLATPQDKPCKYSLNCDIAVDSEVVNWMFEAQSDDVIALLNLKEYTIKFELLETELLTVEFVFEKSMLPMDYYSLGYCIAHSQCQWMLDMTMVDTIDEEMLVAGASLRSDTSGRVVGIRCAYEVEGEVELTFSSINITNMLVGLTNILHLHELSLRLSVQCSDISWPDLSSLQVLQLAIGRGTKKLALDTLLPSLTLESLTLIGTYSIESCEIHMPVGHYIRTAATLKELSLIGINLNEEEIEVIARALASSPLSLERLELWGDKYSFTDIAADCLAQFVTDSTTLQRLCLNRCQFRVGGLRALAQALHHTSAEKDVGALDVFLDDEQSKDDVEKVLCAYPTMRKSIDSII